MLHYKSLFASSLTLSLLCCAGWKIFLKDKILRSCVASSVSVLPMWFSSVTSPELDSEPWNSAPFKRDMGVCSVWCLLWNHQLIICVDISGLWMFSLLFFKPVLSGFTEVSVSGAQVIPDVGMDALGTWAQLFAWSSISEIKCISVLWGSWQLWGNGILAFPDTFHEYQWAQDFLLKFLFPSEMRFNAMPSGLAFLPAAVFFWDCCLVIVWFRPYSIALVINVELITMCWVITGCSAFLGLFWLFQIPLSLGRRLLHLTPLN